MRILVWHYLKKKERMITTCFSYYKYSYKGSEDGPTVQRLLLKSLYQGFVKSSTLFLEGLCHPGEQTGSH